jgi:hypothetical protein
VKKLATTAKGIKAVASGATDPLKAAELRSNVDLTVKEVIPAMRKVKQEIWDPIPDVQWNFFKKDTLGDIDIDKTMLMRLDPRAATGRTVFHEAGGHGLLVRPTEAIKKAQVEYKGELVPATEVMDYIYQVNRSWRGKTDYHTAGWYDKDPAEMLARTVAMDTAKGKDIEQAFLDRLPRVVNAFERTHPEVAEHYRTPLLERVAMKEFEKEMEELPLLIQPKGAPKGKLPPVEERDFVTRMLRELKTSGAEWEANRLSRVKELPKALKKYIVNWDTADVMANFDVLTEATEPTVKGVAPKAKTIEQYYRPANRLSDGTVVWDKWARTHREALDANVGKAKGKRVVSSGGLDPEGNYWEFNFLGDEIPEGIIGKDYLIKGLPKKGFFD